MGWPWDQNIILLEVQKGRKVSTEVHHTNCQQENKIHKNVRIDVKQHVQSFDLVSYILVAPRKPAKPPNNHFCSIIIAPRKPDKPPAKPPYAPRKPDIPAKPPYQFSNSNLITTAANRLSSVVQQMKLERERNKSGN